MDEKLDIIVIGEGLVELSCDVSLSLTKTFDKYYGGDTLAAAVVARRMGSRVGYITRVGCDNFKEYLLDSWQAEGIDISQVKLTEGCNNGLYLLARPKNSEKEFGYYRKKTAASKLSVDDLSKSYLERADYFYTSGVTQSLSLTARETVKKAYEISKELGLITAYDPNYSPLISDVEDAKEYFEEISDNLDILFLNDRLDLQNILSSESIETSIKNLWDRGIQTVVVKSTKNNGYYVGYTGDIIFVPFIKTEVSIDTTSAGDAFNGGFLHALSEGHTPFNAAKYAAIVAGLQTQGIGAIKSIPKKNEVEEIFEKQ